MSIFASTHKLLTSNGTSRKGCKLAVATTFPSVPIPGGGAPLRKFWSYVASGAIVQYISTIWSGLT